MTIAIQYSHRRVLRPLSGLFRTVEVIDSGRAVIVDEDDSRYAVNGRTVPPVALVEVSIFIDPTTGGLWAQGYDLPHRERGPYPVHLRAVPVAQPDDQGGIAWMPSCWCGNGCVCGTCGEQTIKISTNGGLEWSVHSRTGGTHSQRWCARSCCRCIVSSGQPGSLDRPVCCAMPMMVAPVAWVCHRESAHQRPYRWPEQTTDTVLGTTREGGDAAVAQRQPGWRPA